MTDDRPSDSVLGILLPIGPRLGAPEGKELEVGMLESEGDTDALGIVLHDGASLLVMSDG